MSADFWAGYISGATGILIGNPLDLIKTRIQAGNAPSPTSITATPVPQSQSFRTHFDHAGTLVRGATAPILGYGALNAILFVTYNRSLELFGDSPAIPSNLLKVWELVKCRAQVAPGHASSWSIARDVWKHEGIRGLYHGGGITSIRDAVGYGFYFWSYEWSKQAWSSPDDTDGQTAMKVLLCGGLAGVATWVSIFPLDVVKTRVQTQHLEKSLEVAEEQRTLLRAGSMEHVAGPKKLSTLEVAKHAYRTEGTSVFFRGLGICSIRAFVVNAVQWAVYEWMMRLLQPT
ncbi:mitochondrial carrier domain-containing protein [Dendryphion nanum]|uniref:Mitochondrial carrier domain-containing protein n=1 Tax=Dendryphion nanum TaxID=256645 RepID=A0A9P9IGH0_9PLEO|nr:mitochondrial carrier domain-containing protein [Dendryphion nanum]